MAQTHSLDLEASSSQYASITDASQTGLDITGDFTIEAWVKPESLDGTVINKRHGDEAGYQLNIASTGALQVVYASGSGSSNYRQLEGSSGQVVTGVWQFISVTVDVSAGSGTGYVNGKSVSIPSVDGTGTSVAGNARDFKVGVGHNGTSLEKYFDGLIKDVRVFSDIRTQSEIVSDAHTENVSDANLQGEWNFNSVYTDSSGNGNTLTASGSPVFSTTIPWTAPSAGSSVQFSSGMVSWWTMDETSGNRADAHGSNTLTDNNTVGSAAGKWDNAASFVAANSEYFTAADDASFAVSSTFSFAAWIYYDTLPPGGNADWFFSHSLPTTERAYRVRYLEGTPFQWEIRTSSNGTAETVSTINAQTLSTGTWYHFMFVKNGTTGEVFINGISEGTATTTATLHNSTANFAIASAAGSAYDGGFDGRMDEVSFYNTALDYGNILDLYADGAGIPYAEAAGGGTARRLFLMGM